MNVIADVTRSYPGTATKVLERVIRRASADMTMSVLLYDDQLPEFQLAGLDKAYELRSISRMTSVIEVALEMVLDAVGKYPSTVLFSFRAAVLALSSRIDAEAQQKIVFCPWGRAGFILDQARTERALEAMPSTAFAAPIPDPEALAVLKAALEGAEAISPERAVRKTSLRPLMARRDPRFYKTNPATNAPHYISSLLTKAEKTGLVSVRPDPVDPSIWLSGQQQLSLENVPSGRHSSAPMPSAPKTDTPADRFKKILLARKMGPFPNLRPTLYGALEHEAAQNLPIDKVINNCLKTAYETHKDDKKIPWTAVRNFFVTLLTRSRVLVDADGSLVAPSFKSQGTVVKAVESNFADKLDGEIVMCLLDNGAEIDYMDFPALVGTLYLTREFEYHDQLNRVIAHLRDAGRIQYVGESIVKVPNEQGAVAVFPKAGAAS